MLETEVTNIRGGYLSAEPGSGCFRFLTGILFHTRYMCETEPSAPPLLDYREATVRVLPFTRSVTPRNDPGAAPECRDTCTVLKSRNPDN